MYIEGNIILSRIFAYNLFKLNDQGLFYTVGDKYNILITNHPVEIIGLLDISYDDFRKANGNDFFELIANNPYFKPFKFTIDISNGESVLLKNMSDFLAKNPQHLNNEFKKLELKKVFSRFPSFELAYNKAKYNVDNYHLIRRKFNGGVILKNIPNYDKTKLNNTIPHFNHLHFPNDIERDYFILTSSEKELIDEFIKATEKICDDDLL